MQGKIIKGIAGFYYVDCHGAGIITCRARGLFRSNGITPLVGDDVELELIPESGEGNITSIHPRRNSLIRPASANIDQALVVFAVAKPDPNLNLLDRFLVMMQKQGIETTILFNKTDIAHDSELALLKETYELCGHRTLFGSVREKEGIDEIRDVLRGRTTVLAGPSGVGKSSLMNELQPLANMETGSISEKIERGKQTTRHTELIKIGEDTYLMDTPGFSSLYITDMTKEELKSYFVEFDRFAGDCRFLSCNHIKEPDCGVRRALEEGMISRRRYENYSLMFEELSGKQRRR